MKPPRYQTHSSPAIRAASHRLRGTCLAVALLLAGGPGIQQATGNPQGEVVRHGSVTFERVGDELRILQESQKAIIDWQSFSIGSGQSTAFLQPNSSAAALNRVRGPGASRIDGLLRANGRVYLINPNGIVIGPGGTIDVAGFIGSTLDLPDADFLAGGDLNFSGNSEFGVINLGNISAFEGDIFLIGATVENHGTLRAPNGTVGLAAGNDVLIRASGHERVFVRGATGSGKETGVLNTGDIEANIAELKAHGGNVYGMAVRNEGRVAATGVTKEGGQIFLRADGGNISSTGSLTAQRQDGSGGRVEIDSGPGGSTEIGGEINVRGEQGRGGEIVVLGSQITLLPGAWLRADGRDGGGDIFIGGGLRGRDPNLPNADNVTVSEGARLSANALERGDGGRIILFAKDTLRFYGQASAAGGPRGGDGGFVELSGQRQFEIPSLSQQVNVRAAQGSAGTLLIDPMDILILPGSSEETRPNSSVLFADDISAFLEEEGNLLITTQTESEFDDYGDITVASDVIIQWQSSSSLTLEANRDIYFSPGTEINALGGGSIILDAERAITLDSGSQLTTTSGNIELTARGINPEPSEYGISLFEIGPGPQEPVPDFRAGILLDNAIVSTGSGNILVSGTGGESLFGEDSVLGVAIINDSRVETTATGSITIQGFGGAGEFDNHGVFLDSGSSIHAGGSLFIFGESTGAPGDGVRFSGTSGDVTSSGLIGDSEHWHTFMIQGNASDNTRFGVSLLNENARIGWAGVGDPPPDQSIPFLDVYANVGRVQIQRAITRADSVYLSSPADVTTGTISDVVSLFIDAPSIVIGGETITLGDITLLIGSPSEVPQDGIIQILADIATPGKLSLLGGAGADQFIVSAALPENVVFDGSGGFYGDDDWWGDDDFVPMFFSTFESSAGTATLTFAGAPAGVTLDMESLFSITEVTGSAFSDTLLGPNASTTFNLTGPNTFNANDILFNSFENILGGEGINEFVFGQDGSLDGNLIGGGLSDTLDYSAWTSDVTIDFQLGSATAIFGGQAEGFSNIENFIGGTANPGLNHFIGPDEDTVYNIDGANEFSFGNLVTVKAFGNLTGGEGGDTFQVLPAGSLTSHLNGGGGTNLLDYSNYNTAVVVNLGTGAATGFGQGVLNIQNFAGSENFDTVTGPGSSSTYFIFAPDSVEVAGITVTGFENLIGGPNPDVFVFQSGGSLRGFLRGGGNPVINTLDYSTFGAPVTTDFAQLTSTGITDGFLQITNFVGSPTLNDSFSGPDAGTVYRITGLNTFETDLFTVTDYENLAGGGGGDLFRMLSGGQLTGLLDGRGGTDSLNYAGFGGPATVNLGTNTATSLGSFASIENFVGGGGNNTLIGGNGGQTFNVTGNNVGNVAGRTFSGFQTLRGGSGSDSFNFLNLATVGLVDGGGGGNNQLFINNSGFNTGRTYTISSNQVTGPRTWNFTNIQTLRLQLGSGDDTVNTGTFGFSQVLDGGGGTNTLNAGNLIPGGSGSFNNIDYSNFDLPAAGGSIDLGDILDLQLSQQLDQFGGPGGDFGSENRFAILADSDGFNLLLLSALNLADVDEIGDSLVISAGNGDPTILFTVFVIDGSGLKPSNFAVAALAEQLGAAATMELARALGLDDTLTLTALDGAFRVDLSGAVDDPQLLALLARQLSPAAAAELLEALGLEVLLDLFPADGPIAIALPPGAPEPAVLLLLNLQLGPEAEAELSEALSIDQ